MTIAELHGKLATDSPGGVHERLEDLLTSDVFATMKYVGHEYGFLDWLSRAEPAPITPSPPPIEYYLSHSRIESVEYSFWPKLKNKREPDLALLFCFASKAPLLIVVEAKYFSGTSDWEVDEENDFDALTGSQIADQVRGIKQMSKHELLEWFQKPKTHLPFESEVLDRVHLFITMHSLLPVHDYEYAEKQLGRSWPIDSYWLSWTSLAKCLEPHLEQPSAGIAELLGDLYALLHRKDLVPFRGFEMAPWQIYQGNAGFWQELWWSLQPVQLNAYRSFWHKPLWQIEPVEFLSGGTFWEGR